MSANGFVTGVIQGLLDDQTLTSLQSPTYSGSGTGSVPRSVQSKLSEIVSAKDFGAVGDGSTDDTTALQNWINYCVTYNHRGWLPKGNYKITATLNFQTLPGWALEGELSVMATGSSAGACITQYTDNIPIFNLGASSGTYMHSWTIKGITFDYANNQPAANTAAICILFNTMAYEGKLLDCYFNRGFYAMQVANGIGCPWGTTFDGLIFGSGLTGGAMDWSVGINGTPNNHFGRFLANCNNMIGPVFDVRGYSFTIDNIEFLSANQSPILFRLRAGGVCVAGAMKLELFNYTTANVLFDIQANANFQLGHFNIGGTTGVINVPSGQQVTIFSIGTSTPGQAAAIRVGTLIAGLTSNPNGNAYIANVSPGCQMSIRDILFSGWLVTNNGSSASTDNLTIDSFTTGHVSQDLGDTNYTASALAFNTLTFNTAFTAPRTITLPSNGFQLFNGLYFELVFNGSVNGSNTATIVSGATTLATVSTDKMVYRFTWRRNTNAALGWTLVKKESIA